jgi:hypothetical protein
MRKANEVAQPRNPVQTPQDFSRIAREREQKLAERLELQRQQYAAHQKVHTDALIN